MDTHRFSLQGNATVRTAAHLADQLRALPVDGDLVVDCADLAHCDVSALQLLLTLRQRRGGRMRVEGVPDDQAWRFRCVGIDPAC